MKFLLFSIVVFLSVNVSGQRSIYVNPEADQITSSHKLIAVLPFQASVKLRPKQMKDMTAEDLKALEEKEGLAVQNSMHTWLLKRKQTKKLSIDIQDIQKTNAILTRNGITRENISTYTNNELGEMLGIDGLISGNLSTNRPISDGASVVLIALFGFGGATNAGKITININDVSSEKLLWKYEKKLGRGLGSDTDQLINALMRKASRKMPYIN